MAIQRIEQFVATLKNVYTQETIEELCNKELAYLRQEYQVQDVANAKGIYSGLATYKRAITNYRKVVYGVNPKHLAMDYLKLSDKDKENFSKQNLKASFRNIDNAEIWTNHTIEDTDRFIETSVNLLNANSYIDNILGIAALTGRRIGEIGYYSKFELIEQDEFDVEYEHFNMQYCEGLRVIGLAKKQTYAMQLKEISAIIPVLYSPQIIYDAFVDLRKRKIFESFDRFHNAANKELSLKVKKHYNEFLGKCTCHDLRKAYVRIVFDYFAELPSEALPILISKILVQSKPENYLKYSAS